MGSENGPIKEGHLYISSLGDPSFRGQKLTPFLSSVFTSLMQQAKLYLQWIQYILRQILCDESYIMINVDETSLQNDYLQRSGYVVEMTGKERSAAGCFFQKVTIADTRSHITLVAAISARPGLQHRFPQILIPNDSKITHAERDLYKALQFPIEVMLGQHGWVNSEVMKKLMTRYRRAVREIDPTARLVLLMDSASQHISNDVLKHAQWLGIIVLLIPGKLTWLLQPLDVSVFRPFKSVLKKKLLDNRKIDANGLVSMAERIAIVAATITEVLVDTDWHDSFPKVGASLALDSLRNSIKRLMPDTSDIAGRALTNEELADIVGRHRIDIDTRLFRVPNRILDQRTESQLELGPPPMPPPLEDPEDAEEPVSDALAVPVGFRIPSVRRAPSSAAVSPA